MCSERGGVRWCIWITFLPTEQRIEGSNPSRIVHSLHTIYAYIAQLAEQTVVTIIFVDTYTVRSLVQIQL